MLFSRKISILAICTLIATIPATSFADEKIKVPEVGTIDIPSKATSNEGSPTTVLSRHYIDRLHVNGAQISNEDSNVANNLRFYGASSTAAATTQKEVSIPSITKLEAGQIIAVKPTETATKANDTLKLNDFAAYPMRYNGDAISTSTDSIVWNQNYVSFFVFDGTYWQFAGGGIDNNTTYSGMSQAEITATTPVTTNRLVSPQLLRQNLARRPQNEAVGSATKPVYVASDGMVTEVTHELNADVPSTAVFTDTVTTVKNSDGTDGASTAADGSVQVTKDGTTTYPVVQGWANKQNKNTVDHYSVNKNGTWLDASAAITADETYLTETANDTDGSTQIGIKTANLANAGTNITGLTDSSAAADKGKLTTAYAVKEAITSATSGMITDVSGKQDKDNNQIYKVGYNGGWENAYNAIGVDTTYLKKTDNSTNGTTQVAVDSTKLASAKANITDLTSSSTDANKGKLTTAWAVNQALGDLNSNINGVYNHAVNGAPLATENSTYWGIGEGGASQSLKTVQIDSIKDNLIKEGLFIIVTPKTTSNVANPLLKLNEFDELRISYNGSATISAADSGKIWKAGVPSMFVFNKEAGLWEYVGSDTTYTQGDGITISGTTINNAGVRDIRNPDNTTASTTIADGTIRANINGTVRYPKVRGWDKTVKYDGTNAVGSATKGVYVNASGVVTEMTHSVNADVPSTAEFTDTTYSFTTGSASGTISVTPEGGSAYNVTVKDAEVTTHKLAQGDATGTVITSSATDTQYPSAKAVYNAITSATNAADISDHTVNGAPLSNEASYYYGSGVGGATSTAKTVQINSITTAPTAGMTIVVNPATTATSGTSMTLNLNGTGAKAVKYEGSTTLTNAKSAAIWKKDVPVVFVYDGTNWLYEGNKYIAGTGITVSGSVITNTGVRSVATGTGNDGTISVNTNGTAADVSVKGWANKQNKPATAEVAAGKVLTYNGTGDANGTNNYSAKYIQVPVANNAPNGSNVTVSTLADIWVE